VSTSILDAAMILLKSVVQIATRPMSHILAELRSDGFGIDVMTVLGDRIRSYTFHSLCRSKERLGGSKVPLLARHHVYQGAVAINRAI
jgi:hypothetical protein